MYSLHILSLNFLLFFIFYFLFSHPIHLFTFLSMCSCYILGVAELKEAAEKLAERAASGNGNSRNTENDNSRSSTNFSEGGTPQPTPSSSSRNPGPGSRSTIPVASPAPSTHLKVFCIILYFLRFLFFCRHMKYEIIMFNLSCFFPFSSSLLSPLLFFSFLSLSFIFILFNPSFFRTFIPTLQYSSFCLFLFIPILLYFSHLLSY